MPDPDPDARQPAGNTAGMPDVLRVRGADAAHFLQAQLTVDIEQCGEGKTVPFGWCNPAGRVLASGWLLRQNQTFYLLLAAGRAGEVGAALGRYILRAKVVIDAAGVAVAARNEQADGLLLPGAPPRRFALIADASSTDPERVRRWQRAGIRAGVCELPESLAGRWLPQMLNLDLVGGLSFSKGCYPGQEIVARTHHLGKVKRRLFCYASDAAAPAPGAAVLCGQEKCGEVLCSVPVENGSELLAVVELKYAHQELRLAPPASGTLKSLPLPYAVPAA